MYTRKTLPKYEYERENSLTHLKWALTDRRNEISRNTKSRLSYCAISCAHLPLLISPYNSDMPSNRQVSEVYSIIFFLSLRYFLVCCSFFLNVNSSNYVRIIVNYRTEKLNSHDNSLVLYCKLFSLENNIQVLTRG